jgi:hypothetical protein
LLDNYSNIVAGPSKIKALEPLLRWKNSWKNTEMKDPVPMGLLLSGHTPELDQT